MHRAYGDTRHGQVHVRKLGDGPRTLLLIHWTPLSGRMYEGIAPLFAAAGFQVIAPDLLGYGRSDARPSEWSIEAWADNVHELLDGLGVSTATVLGGHLGACIATELALRHPARIDAVILDGCPLLTPELRAAFAKLTTSPPPADPQVIAQRATGLLAEYIPGYEAKGEALSLLWPTMIDYLETGFVSSAPIAAAYDIAVRLPLVKQPALLLGAELDSLAANFDEAMARLCPEVHHKFAGHHPLHFADRHGEYAQIVLDFLNVLKA